MTVKEIASNRIRYSKCSTFYIFNYPNGLKFTLDIEACQMIVNDNNEKFNR